MKPQFNFFKLLTVTALMGLSSFAHGKAQPYGIGFYSHEVVADQRTGLELFPNKNFSITKKFQLSFEMTFLPQKGDYFGYIFRIIENNSRNIDLIYNKRTFTLDKPGENPNHFDLVMGDKFTKINFNISREHLLKRWNKIILEFDFDQDQLIATINNHKYVQPHAKLNKKNTYKFLFGINNCTNFRTRDAAPVKIRNIKITSANKIKYQWPLNESQGNIAHEIIDGQNGKVSHPMWIRAAHRSWHLVKTMKVKGVASVAFNPSAEILYTIGSDSLWSFLLKNSQQTSTPFLSGKQNSLLSNESIFNVYDHKLYNYYIDKTHKTVSVFDFKTKKWDKDYPYIPSIDYWHSNSFFSKADSALYIVGGYGQLTYKNNIYRYHLVDHTWQEIKTNGDFYCPRYLAACGTVDNGKTVYFLGGYGSLSGQQMLNPKNLYDLLKYNVKTKTFKKIYQLKAPEEGFSFANSMIINEKKRTFTALVFSNHKYNSNLQLMVGSLDHPSYQMVGSKIPYAFYDTHSFANLFYNPKSNQLIAVTLFRSDQNNSVVKIYTLLSPPDTQPSNAGISISSTNFKSYLWILIGCAAIVICIIFLRKWKKQSKKIISPLPAVPPATDHLESKKSSVLLFGDLKISTSDGKDITQNLTSLIKELFIIVIIYSIKSGSGISPEKLLEILWTDKTETNAKNNRSANLSKLKSFLSQIQHLSLSRDTGNWKIEIDFDHVYVDYYHYLQVIKLAKKNLTKELVGQLIEITQRNGFLTNADYPCLDQIKSEVSNETIDIYLQYTGQVKIGEDPEFLILLANCIFSFDPANEEAMIIKCKALSHLGKHSLSKSAFQAFSKEYMALYGEEFKKDFHSIIES